MVLSAAVLRLGWGLGGSEERSLDVSGRDVLSGSSGQKVKMGTWSHSASILTEADRDLLVVWM